jgi:hypothetical protein
MLQDVVDLRKNKWKPRRETAGPKTIDQVTPFPTIPNRVFL